MRGAVLAAALLVAAPAAFAQDLEALERQLDKAREAAPMTIRNFMLIEQPARYFGDYQARKNDSYARGQKIHFYAEPRNLVPKRADGMYETALEVDIEVAPEKGEAHKQPKFMSVKIPSRSRIQDLYLNMSVSLGEAPAGKYNIKFVVRDANSKKSAAVTQGVVLK